MLGFPGTGYTIRIAYYVMRTLSKISYENTYGASTPIFSNAQTLLLGGFLANLKLHGVVITFYLENTIKIA